MVLSEAQINQAWKDAFKDADEAWEDIRTGKAPYKDAGRRPTRKPMVWIPKCEIRQDPFLGQSSMSSNKVSQASTSSAAAEKRPAAVHDINSESAKRQKSHEQPGNPELAAEYDKFNEELAVLQASTSAAAAAAACAFNVVDGASGEPPAKKLRYTPRG